MILIFTALALLSCQSVEPIQPNHYPVIHSFGVVGNGAVAGEEATLFCVVTDEDGDSLSYLWSAPVGTFAGSGDSISWWAPEEVSKYQIYCRVEDGRGGYGDFDFQVQVFPGSQAEAGRNHIMPIARRVLN